MKGMADGLRESSKRTRARRPVTVCLAALALGLVMSHATPSEAGLQFPGSGSCFKASDGSGDCSGTFVGFRSLSDPQNKTSAFAAFFRELDNGTDFRSFYAYYNNQYYGCNASTNGAYIWVYIVMADLVQDRGSFSVSWDSTGTCNAVFFANTSTLSNY